MGDKYLILYVFEEIFFGTFFDCLYVVLGKQQEINDEKNSFYLC